MFQKLPNSNVTYGKPIHSILIELLLSAFLKIYKGTFKLIQTHLMCFFKFSWHISKVKCRQVFVKLTIVQTVFYRNAYRSKIYNISFSSPGPIWFNVLFSSLGIRHPSSFVVVVRLLLDRSSLLKLQS